MVLKRHVATVLWLVLGAGACTLLVRGTIDEYPEADGDGDADSGVDGACVGEDGGVPGLEAKCEDFCRQQVPCPDDDLNAENCPVMCPCYFGKIYKPGFARFILACLHDNQLCAVSDEGLACVMAAYQFVNVDSCAAFVDLCTRRAVDLGCGELDGGPPPLDCELALALQPGVVDRWADCLARRSCELINSCRDLAFLQHCEIL